MARAVRVDLVADPTRFVRGMRQAQGSSQRFTQHTSAAGSALKTAFAAFSAGAVVVGLKKAVDAASAMNETTSKTKVVFGPASKAVTDFAKNAATSMGLSRQEAMEAAATFGNLFVSMKIGAPQAATMSTEMVKLAGDLASFNNANPADTLEALRSGLVGETEPLRKFGINLNDADLRQKALSMGLTKTTKDVLPPAIKAQAAYALILDQSKTAQGDFARTSDGLANKQRILSAQWKDAQATIGGLLLPAMLTLVSAMSGFISVVDDNRTAFGILFGVLAAGTAIVGTLIVASKIHAAVTEAITVATAAWATVQKGMNLILGTTAVQATAATAAEEGLAVATATSGAAAKGAAASFGLLAGSVGLLTAGIGLGVFSVKTWIDTVKKGTEENEKFGGTVQLGTKFGGLYAQTMEDSAVATSHHTTATADSKQALDDLNAATKKQQEQAVAVNAAIDAQTAALKPLKEEFKGLKAGVQSTIESYEGLVTASDVTTGQVIKGLHDQVANFKTYSRDVKELIKRGVDPAAIRELSEKGPQFVHALAEGSNAQLKKYKGYWKARQDEVKGSFAASMESQYQGLVKKIRDMQKQINSLKGKTVDVGVTGTVKWDKNAALLKELTGNFTHKLPAFAAGGRLDGYGGGDSVLAMLEPGEAIIPKDKASQRGFQEWAKAQGIPGFQAGGTVGGAPRNLVTPSSDALRYSSRSALAGASALHGRDALAMLGLGGLGVVGGGGGGTGGTVGYAANAWRVFARAFGLLMGGRAARSNPSDHPIGKAIDVMTSNRELHRAIIALGQRLPGAKYWISYRQIGHARNNFDPRYYGGPNPHTDHVHWSFYDKGGWLKPGATLAVNRTGSPEPIGFDYEKMADAFVRALEARPPNVYLDRQKVSRAVRDGDLWESRR